MEMTAPGVLSQAEMSGAEITMRCLQEEGVEFVFGYPGGAILPIYDEMFKQDKATHPGTPRAGCGRGGRPQHRAVAW
jgi:hypothetical protein